MSRAVGSASGAPLLVVGDALLDRDVEGSVERLCPDAPVPVLDEHGAAARPGGAALAAALAAADGHEVTLLTALADDAGGNELAAALAAGGVELVDLGLAGPTPEKVRLRAAGRSLLRLDRGGREGATVGPLTAAARAAIEWADAVLVSDYGRGLVRSRELREALARRARGAPLVWDPHPRGPVPVAGAALATPNEAEATRFAPDVAGGPPPAGAAGARATALAERWRARAVCVTRGAAGAVLSAPGAAPLVLSASRVSAGDPCGAGDRFAARAAGSMAGGADVDEAVAAAVSAASDFVAAGGAANAPLAAAPTARAEPGGGGLEAIERVRARGGVVVATGGCFDLLHAGHVHMLQAARALGDCLVVCLNSDASVRRLKGPRRPVVSEDDRTAVLLALGCVDAVTIFGEDTPAAALERIRPDVFAKGGDYVAADLPERAIVERLGGRVVVLPYVAGHSTSALIEEVDRAAG